MFQTGVDNVLVADAFTEGLLKLEASQQDSGLYRMVGNLVLHNVMFAIWKIGSAVLVSLKVAK